MAGGNELNVKLKVESILKEKGLVDLKVRLDAAEKELARFQGRAEGMKASTGMLGGAVKGMVGTLGGLFALGQIGGFIIRAADGQRDMARRTEALRQELASMGLDVDASMKRIDDFTGSMAGLTGLVDDYTIPVIQKFVGLTGSVEAALAGVKLAADIAAGALGGDFAKAADYVSAILAGRANEAARNLGINIKDLNGETKTNVELVDEIIAKYDGMSEKVSDAEKKTNQLKGAWDLFSDTIGDAAQPILDVGKNVIGFLVENVARAVAGLMMAGKALMQLPARIKAGITGDRIGLFQLDRELDDFRKKLLDKFKAYEEANTGVVKMAESQRQALRDAAARKDLEEQRKAAEERRKLAEKAAKEEADAEFKKWARIQQLVVDGQEAIRKSGLDAMNRRFEDAQKSAMAGIEARLSGEIALDEQLQQNTIEQLGWEAERYIEHWNTLSAEELRVAKDTIEQKKQAELEWLDAQMAAELVGVEKGSAQEMAILSKYAQKRVALERGVAVLLMQLDQGRKLSAREAAVASINALAMAFPKNKAFAIASALINTYEAVTKAYASAPPPWNFVLAAAVLAAGLAQVNAIRKAKPMAEGGILTGPTQVLAGEAGTEAFIPLTSGRADAMLGRALARAAASPAAGARGGAMLAAAGGRGATVINISVPIQSRVTDRRTLRQLHRELQRVAREDLARYVR